MSRLHVHEQGACDKLDYFLFVHNDSQSSAKFLLLNETAREKEMIETSDTV